MSSVRELFDSVGMAPLPVLPFLFSAACFGCDHNFLTGRSVDDLYSFPPDLFSPACSLPLEMEVRSAFLTADTVASLVALEVGRPELDELFWFPLARIFEPFEFCADGSRLLDRLEFRVSSRIAARPAGELDRFLSGCHLVLPPSSEEVLVLYRGVEQLTFEARVLSLAYPELARFYASPSLVSSVLLRLPGVLVEDAFSFAALSPRVRYELEEEGAAPVLDAEGIVAHVPAPALSPAELEVLVGLLPELGLPAALEAVSSLSL